DDRASAAHRAVYSRASRLERVDDPQRGCERGRETLEGAIRGVREELAARCEFQFANQLWARCGLRRRHDACALQDDVLRLVRSRAKLRRKAALRFAEALS